MNLAQIIAGFVQDNPAVWVVFSILLGAVIYGALEVMLAPDARPERTEKRR